ncbi:MAG: insulinase family protein [Gammaproteobacteria bacterium]|nr:insulinase family protein [Gammaproteobacteria bacterium]
MQTPIKPQALKPSTIDPKVYEAVLDNGLKLIIKEDNRAPVMVSQVWYKVGSSYEHNGITGVSHVLEHMMFKGTKKHPPGEFSRIIAENGGRENAFTGKDYTAYFQQMENMRLPISFELEADRMRNVVLLDDEFQKEIKVVMEERRMRTEDDPQAMTYEQFNATAFVNSPYHAPIIGWMNDLENMTVDDLAEWYRIWYAPNNATLVVVGDIKADEVYTLAKKYFASVPASNNIPQVKPRQEVTQLGERRIIVKAPAQLPYLIMGYKAPSIVNTPEEWEPYAMDVLAYVLDGGNSARFSKNLVRGSQVAAGVSTSYDAFTPGQELMIFSGTPGQGHDVKALEKAIRAELEAVKSGTISARELDRIKAQVMAAKVYELDSVFYQAMSIGMLETTGIGWPTGEAYVDRIKQVTAAQVQQVAKKYLIDDYLTVAILDPQPIDSSQPRRAAGGRHGR